MMFITYLIAVPFSLIFEVPFINLNKLLNRTKPAENKQVKDEHNNGENCNANQNHSEKERLLTKKNLK